jgi:imidazolonepropionase-like amidohydrolase
MASQIWPGSGPVINDAVMIVTDGKVTKIGKIGSIEVPASAKRHDYSTATLIPGLVVAQTNLVESNSSVALSLAPEIRAVDGFDPYREYDKYIEAGITTVQLSPGSSLLMPGQGAVVKLGSKDSDKRVLSDSESLRIVLTREAMTPPTVYEPPVGAVSVDRPLEPTRPQLATSLAEAIVGLDVLFTAAKKRDTKAPDGDPVLETLAKLVSANRTLRFVVENNYEVRAALSIAKKFELPWLLVDLNDTTELKATDWKSARAIGVILSPEMRAGRIVNPTVPVPDRKPTTEVWVRAKELIEAGIGNKLAMRPPTDADLTDIFFLASLFKRGGLTTDQILSMVTNNPASMMGVGDRVGSLKPAADADFVVLSGRPFETGTRVLATYIDGKSVFNAEVDGKSTVIEAASVYTPQGIVSGGVAVRNGKISGIGAKVSSARNSAIKRFPKGVVVPGLIDSATNVGLGGNLSESLPLNAKLGDLLARDDDQVKLARQGGITTGLISSSRLPSPVLAFKLTDSPRVIQDPVALRFHVGGNLTSAEESMRRILKSGKAYADSWIKYEADNAAYQTKLKEYEAAKSQYDAAKAAEAKAAEAKAAEAKAAEAKKVADGKTELEKKPEGNKPDGKETTPAPSGTSTPTKKPEDAPKPSEPSKPSDAKPADAKPSEPGSSALVEPKKPEEPKKVPVVDAMEPYRPLFAKKIAAMVEANDSKAIALAIKLFRTEFDLTTAIVSNKAAAEEAELLSKNGVLVVTGPVLIGEEDGQVVNFPSEIAASGIPIAFQSQTTTGTSKLPDVVAYAVYQGLGFDDALRGMSQWPASFLKLSTVGSIELGKDADLVVLSGPPFELSSEVLAVMIDGKWVYEKESK